MTVERLRASLADRYRLERELGQGGMATVYLAADLKHDRQVALKVLRPELAAVIGAERFLQEIKVTANLQHSHILPLYDSGVADSFLYYVMPYVEGETLRTRLDREKQLGVEPAIAIACKVASALEHAHRQGVIHRDIKPENILLRDGEPLIADFGIALAVNHAGGSRLTETGLSLGTPHYMSPEQAMGDRELDARSDVYSLAAVLYEMLIGDPPHQGSTAQAIVAKVITERPTAVHLLRDTVPEHVSAAIQQGLAKLPADRFPTAAGFATALTTPAAGGPKATRTQPVAAAPARSRDPLVLGLAAALLVSLAVGVWGWMRPESRTPTSRVRIALGQHLREPGDLGRDLTLSPDGSTIVFADSSGGPRLWIKTADHPDPEPVTGTDGAYAPAFSPDGQWIAFIADGKLRKVPRSGGSAVTIADSAADQGAVPPSVAWLDNGSILYSNRAFGLSMVDQEGGAIRAFNFLSSVGTGVATIAPLTGGRAAILGMCDWGCPVSRLAVVDLDSGQLDSLTEGLRAWQLADGRIGYVTLEGGVFVASYDASRHRLHGTPTPVLEGVRTAKYWADMALASNGTLLYVAGQGAGANSRSEVLRVDRQGRTVPVDSTWSFIPSENGGTRLSPDGRRLALSVIANGREELWIKQLDRGPFVRLSLESSGLRPEWSPDGRYVYFFSQTNALSSGLRRHRADGSGSDEPILHATRATWELQQTRDSNLMVVRLGVPPTRDIYLFDRRKGTGDSAISPLIADDRYEENAVALSPDGRWLAYASNESGRYEVYVRPFPDVNAGRWQISAQGGQEPRWAHSGRELFYRRGDQKLVSVAVTPAPTFVPGEQRALFDVAAYQSNTAYSNYDVAPGDQHFIFLHQIRSVDSSAVTTAVLVQQWRPGLRTRSGGN